MSPTRGHREGEVAPACLSLQQGSGRCESDTEQGQPTLRAQLPSKLLSALARSLEVSVLFLQSISGGALTRMGSLCI